MKTLLKPLIGAVIGSVLVTGCGSTHFTRWEYKVVTAPRQTGVSPSQLHEAQQQFLNEQGRDGWILVSQNEGSVYYLSRPVQ